MFQFQRVAQDKERSSEMKGLFSRGPSLLNSMAAIGLAMPACVGFCAEAGSTGVVAPGAVVEKASGDFRFTEGPAADAEGNVFFSDIPNERIHKWSAQDGSISLHRENTGGANGLMFDAQGRLLACEGGARRVTRDDMKGGITVLADAYEGKKLNSPNDLWIDPKGGVYFTDPRYGKKAEPMEQDGEHVYYISPQGGAPIRVTDDLARPNGLIGLVDGSVLYIADHGDGKTWTYNVQPDGTLAGKRLFAERGSDGVALDERGNVYLTDDAVYVYDPQGAEIERIEIPERPANLTFAGKERKTLFITARTSVYTLEMAVQGAPAPVDR
jgi:gluconolactonase